MSTCDARSENRRNFPRAAEILDEFRLCFGEQVKITYAQEGGRSVGKKQTGYFMTATQWLNLSRLIEFDKKRIKK